MKTFNIVSWLETGIGSYHLVGRETGQLCRVAIEHRLRLGSDGAVMRLDLEGVDHLDYTAADECFVKLARRLQGLEYGDQYVILSGLTSTQAENIQVALERVKLLPAASGAPGTRLSFGRWTRRGWVGAGYLVARRLDPDGKSAHLVDRFGRD